MGFAGMLGCRAGGRRNRPEGPSALNTCRTGPRPALGVDDAGGVSSLRACRLSFEALAYSVRLEEAH
ncbi:MAG: hypothetical protein AVDCRST_MAG83-1896 [uncultured Arthrobacter sp.]|uniref:Uncharacterized protein n=1 Tax=uncultured Arthrobacter sp. TaxID=114050 RepID=A0A6J4I8Z5_9MICC|nr:MAG: hypothetical protein AVDCRST_MAG83-1896 [uncultured Arthrobacter sp.]